MKPDNTPATDYYLKYGLERDPFPPAADDVLYRTPAFEEQVQHIKEAIAGSQKVVLVSSAAGAGKSTLADYLETRPEENWRISLIQAESHISKEALAYRLIQAALPDKADKPAMAIPMLHKYLELSSHAGFVPVFIIDDVDKLPADALKFLLELATLRYAESLYRIVLFADESIISRLEDPALGGLASDNLYTLQLSALSPQQTREYIHARLNAAGENGDSPFDDDKLECIHSVSGGLPGRINLVAREAMQTAADPDTETVPEAAVPVPANDGKGGKMAAGIAIVSVIVLSSWFYLSRNGAGPEEKSHVTTAKTVEAQPDDQAAAEPEPLPAPAGPSVTSDRPAMDTPQEPVAVTESTQVSSAEPGIAEDIMPETFATDEPAADPVPETAVTGTAQQAAAAEPAGVPHTIAETSVTETVATPSVTPDGPTVTTAQAIDETNIYNLATVPAVLAGIRGNGWYRQQSRSAYTLQLISASDIDNVIELLEAVPGIRTDVSGYVKYTPSGRPRYLMFYGLYTDKTRAEAAIAGLPDALRAVNPWPRSIGNITDEIDTVIAPSDSL